ncbi:hypothetical protein [Streptomyces sp. DH12]|uniref:hypothetical protein n=1 Tax=Streptomyces sp. DH12 TaxID=2857010 RepID=UPI0027DFBF85|nr:hypothetical protein [Streptomyces sp. DH12]
MERSDPKEYAAIMSSKKNVALGCALVSVALVAGTVALDSLKLSALRTAVAMAVASGATSLEAAAVVTEAESASDEDRAAVRDLGGAETPVLVAGPDGTVRETVTAG